MEHCYWKLYVHLVWSTKHRSNILRDRLEQVAHDAIRDGIREFDMVPICVNSAWNHTHVLVSWNPSKAVDQSVQSWKQTAVERWNRFETPSAPTLQWQNGWAAFSVSPGKVDHAKWYVANQKTLHRDERTIDRYETFKGQIE